MTSFASIECEAQKIILHYVDDESEKKYAGDSKAKHDDSIMRAHVKAYTKIHIHFRQGEMLLKELIANPIKFIKDMAWHNELMSILFDAYTSMNTKSSDYRGINLVTAENIADEWNKLIEMYNRMLSQIDQKQNISSNNISTGCWDDGEWFNVLTDII